MSIRAIGTDIVAVARIRALFDRHGERFLSRLLTDAERRRCDGLADPAPFLARRFAAKEAAAKALGTGIAAGVTFRSIEVDRPEHGPPRLTLHGAAAERARALGVESSHLSISDEQAYAIAFVVLES